MTPNSLETVILLLFFFLPGYIYFLVSSWFKFQSWNDEVKLFLGFLFNSIIFQFISWQSLKIFGVDIIRALSSNQTFVGFLIPNFQLVATQFTTAIIVSLLVAIILSLKQTARIIARIRFLLKDFLNPGLDYTPSLPGIFYHSANQGKEFVGCVIELKDGTLYNGNILHIGFNSEEKDFMIVLNKVSKMKGDKRKDYPDDLKVLIPYENINTIVYKEFQATKGVQTGFIGLNPLNLSLFLTIILLILLFMLQKQISSSNFLGIIVELLGAFVVTFLGVYISFSYAKKSDQEKEQKEREKVYVGGLKLLASELRLNEQLLPPLNDAIDAIPDDPDKYYYNYGFILEMTRGIKTDVFYNLISSGTIHEISKSDDIFNKVQQAYYNIQGSINGISLSRKVFEDFADKPTNIIPQGLIDMAKGIINNESQKLKRTIEMVRAAREEIEKELSAKYGVTFTDEFSIKTKGK